MLTRQNIVTEVAADLCVSTATVRVIYDEIMRLALEHLRQGEEVRLDGLGYLTPIHVKGTHIAFPDGSEYDRNGFTRIIFRGNQKTRIQLRDPHDTDQ